jgi:carboxypeptidase family protein
MRKLSLVGGSLATMTLVALLVACGYPDSRIPTSPGAPSISSLEISGPASVAPGQSAQFSVTIRLSDGTRKSASPDTKVKWQACCLSFVRVDASGLVTAPQQVGDTTLTAEVSTAGGVRRSTKEVSILPDGTYRMVGVVNDAEFPAVPIAGARVEVTPGPVVATTDFGGQYRLYGVPAEADVRVTRDGYAPIVQSLRLTAHVTRNFQLAADGQRLNLTGKYTLAIDVNGCQSSRPVTPDLQHRRYEAVLTQQGPTVDVTLTEPRFRLNSVGRGNRFSGTVDSAGATFTLRGYAGDYYYYHYGSEDYPDLMEQLPDGTILNAYGKVVATASAGVLSGQTSVGGALSNWDWRVPMKPVFVGGCSSVQLTLTRR